MPSNIDLPVLGIYAIAAVVLFLVAIAPFQLVLRAFLARPIMWRFERMMKNRPSSSRKIKADPDYTKAERRLEKLNNAKFITMVVVLLGGIYASLRFPTLFLKSLPVKDLPKTLDDLSATVVGIGHAIFDAGSMAGPVHMVVGVLVAFVASLVVVNLLDYLFAFLGYLIDRVLHAEDYARTSAKAQDKPRKAKTGSDSESGTLQLPNYYELLGLSPEAPIPAIATLLDAQEQNLQNERSSGKATKKTRRQLDLITEARETLLDQGRRAAYHQAMGIAAVAPQQMETIKVRGGIGSMGSRDVSDEQRERMEQMKRMRRGGGGGEGL